MAVAFSVERAEDPDSTNTNAFTVGAAFTPAADTLLLNVNGSVDQGDATYSISSVVGGSLSWNSIRAADVFTSTQFWRLESFTALVGGSPASTTVVVTYSENITGHNGWVGEFTGHDATTPIKQSAGASNGTTDPNVSLGAAPDSDSATVGCAAASRNPPAWTPAANWTEQMDNGHGTPASGLGVYTSESPNTQQTFSTTGTDVSHCSQIYEIDAAAAGGAATWPGWAGGGWWLLPVLSRVTLLRCWATTRMDGWVVQQRWEHPMRDVILAARDGLYVPTTREILALQEAA